MRVLILVAALALAACDRPTAETTDAGASSGAPAATAQVTAESEVLRAVAMYEAYETQACLIAQSEGDDPGVQTFVRAMAQDRDAASGQLATAMASVNAQVSSTLDENYEAYLEALRTAPEGSFDGQFASQQALVHVATLGAVERYIEAHPEGALRGWADTNVARLRANLALARALPR
jgi:predicted outer membrane protein